MEQQKEDYLPIGTYLQGGKYKIEKSLGCGGFGNTYLVTHSILDVKMAVKEFFIKDMNLRRDKDVVISMPKYADTFKKQRERFVEEARRIARIHNQNIVRVSDVFDENGTSYYVMDYIDGQSLDSYVKQQGPLSESEVLPILDQQLSALEEIHSQKPALLHLDIKPANIMLNTDGTSFLVDFGASKHFDENGGIATVSSISLTKSFAPLELVDLDTQHIGPWTDYYELGATLYFLLTGQQPPTAAKLSQGAELTFPSSVSQQMRQIVSYLMQTNFRDRPQTVNDIRKRMNGCHGETTVKHEETTVKHEDTLTVNKQSLLWLKWLIAAVFIGLIVLFLLVLKCGNKPVPVEKDEPVVIDDKDKKEDKDEDIFLFCPDDNHPHLIDLGLPSGTLWACCNVGTRIPEGYGGYFAWGETAEKDEYVWSTYAFYDSNAPRGADVRYIGDDIAGTNYDAATVNWGAQWQMPTGKQSDELITHCVISWTTLNGVRGQMVKGSNGGTIFLPAAGWRHHSVIDSLGTKGGYWTSSCIQKSQCYSKRLILRESISTYGLLRYFGQSVRPVSTKKHVSSIPK